MDAGRELDSLIAEKVMGYEKLLKERDGKTVELFVYPIFGPCAANRYSTDLSAAWEIMSKLTAAPLSFDFEIVYQSRFGYMVRFIKDAQTLREASAKDLPLAICLAALSS
jgi:hypothetical protein